MNTSTKQTGSGNAGGSTTPHKTALSIGFTHTTLNRDSIYEQLTESAESPLNVQVGGDHYKKYKIQPIEYCHANDIPMIEGSIIKYATRWRDKGGIQDLKKIKHLCDLLVELENKRKRGIPYG